MPQIQYNPASPWNEIFSSTKMFYADELRQLFDNLPVTTDGIKQGIELFPKILNFLKRIIKYESNSILISESTHLTKYMEQIQRHYANNWHISPESIFLKLHQELGKIATFFDTYGGSIDGDIEEVAEAMGLHP